MRSKFTGKPESQTTGLYYEYERWYDPSIGRFISQDPLGGSLSDPESLNPYVYIDDSPTIATDPSGMDCGFGADNRCEKLHQCSSAGPDPLLTWWNGLSPTQQGLVILAGVLTVAVISCAIGCEGFAAVPEAAAGAGLDLGLGSLSIGTLGLGALGIGALGLDLGLTELGSSLHPSGGGSPLGSTGPTGGTVPTGDDPAFGTGSGPGLGGKRPPDVPPDLRDPNKIRPPRWGEPGKTIPSGAGKPSPSSVRKVVCAALGLGGILTGFIARAETSDTGLNYPVAGGVGGLVACLAFLGRN